MITYQLSQNFVSKGLPELIAQERERLREVQRGEPRAYERRKRYLAVKATAPKKDTFSSSSVRTSKESTSGFKPMLSNCLGTKAILRPRLLPAQLRHKWVEASSEVTINIHITMGTSKIVPPIFFAQGDSARQKLRKTWKERNNWNRLPEDNQIHIAIVEYAKSLGMILRYP